MPVSKQTKRPTGFTRRACALFGAAVAVANAGAPIARYVFTPGAFTAHVAAQEKLQAQREAERRRESAEPLTFREFVALVNPRYRFYKHCEILGDVLQRVAEGEISRLMIFMPPRHGKSEETSRLFTAYFLYRYPEKWVGMASYAADLAYTLSRSAKDHFVAAGGELRDDAKAVKHWQTRQGGGLWAGGVGGPCTGKGFHLGVIDDPIKNAEEAGSDKVRTRNQDWYQSTFSTREEPGGGALVVIQTRWNENDLAGWLIEQERSAAEDEKQNWHVVNLPAIAEEMEPGKFPESCTVEPDWRQPGEALCPERYTVERLKRLAAQVGLYFWNALFQQRPRPREGGIFKREWFTVCGAVPVGSKYVRYWDKAGSTGKGDWTAGVLMARSPDGLFFVVDVVRGQWAATEREAIILQTAELDRQRIGAPAFDGRQLDGESVYQIWMEQEGGSGGKESAAASCRNLAGFAVQAETVSGDKATRADPFAAQCGVGNVRLVRGAWNEPYLNELTGFPNASHDDQVDGSSGAFNHLALGRRWEFD